MLTSPFPLSTFSTTSDSSAGAGALVAVLLMGVLYAALVAFGIYLYMRVAKKAGWSLWHGLLVLVPVANIVFIIMFVFMEWPVERRVREAEARLAALTGGDPYGYGAGGYPPGGYPPGGYGTPTGYDAPGTPPQH